MSISYKLFRGSTDKRLTVTYVYRFEAEGDFRTVYQKEGSESAYISPSFGISISNGYDKDRVYVTTNQYFTFVTLFEQIVRLVSQHLHELFPNAGRSEFEINAKALERFQTEEAVASEGITMIPCVYVDETNQCFPGIQINTLKFGSIKIPLQDAIPMNRMFKTFDPHGMSISMLRILGKIE